MPHRKPGILTLAYYFDPSKAIGAQRPWRFHRYLTGMGYESRVIAATVATGSSDESITVVPDVAGSFWEKRTADIEAGRPLDSMPLNCHGERILRKTVLPGQYAMAWSWEATDTAAALVRRNPNTSVVLSTYPPIGTHAAAFFLARKLGMRWIADFRDPFGEAPGMLANWGIGKTEQLVFRNAAAIIANTESAAARWREKFPWAAGKIHVIWNGYDPENEATPSLVPQRSERHIVHAGNLYGNRNANVILEGLARLRTNGDQAARATRVILAGPSDTTSGINQDLHRSAINEGWLQADGASIPQVEAQRLTREADGLLLLQPQSTVQVPAKLFEYMSIGRPVLALTPHGSSIEWILSRAGVPYVCVYSDDSPDVVDHKLAEYLSIPNTPTPVSEWYRTMFDGKRQTAQLAKIIDGVAKP